MKINIVIPFIYRTGGVKILVEYSNRLVKKGHNVVLYYPLIPYNTKRGNFAPINFLKMYYRLLKQLISLNDNKEKFNEMLFEIKQVPVVNNFFIRDADAVIASSWPTAYSVNKLSKEKGEKYYFVQDYEDWDSNIDLVNGSYKLCLKLITTCKYLHDLILEKTQVDSVIIFIGIDENLFYNHNKIYDKDKPKTILFIDSGMKRKNSLLAIEVVKKIKSQFSDVNCISFGHRKFHEMPPYIDFIMNPSDEEIRQIYSLADIFICTSNIEGFALPPAEAMSCKCAVVTSIVGAVKEYSIHMRSAIHVLPGDEKGFLDAVSLLISNYDLWKQISTNGYEDAKKYLYCWDDSANKLEAFLRSNL